MLSYTHWAIKRYRRIRIIHRINIFLSRGLLALISLAFGYSMIKFYLQETVLAPIVFVVLISSAVISIVTSNDDKLTDQDIEMTMAGLASGAAATGISYGHVPGVAGSKKGVL